MNASDTDSPWKGYYDALVVRFRVSGTFIEVAVRNNYVSTAGADVLKMKARYYSGNWSAWREIV